MDVVSNDLKTIIQNSINGNVDYIYIGALNPSTESGTTSSLSISIKVEYTVSLPARSCMIRNNFYCGNYNAGIVGVGTTSGSYTQHTSPYLLSTTAGKTIYLKAYDNQMQNSGRFVFNDTEEPNNNLMSFWQFITPGVTYPISSSAEMSFNTSSFVNVPTYEAVLYAYWPINIKYTTEFDGTINSGTTVSAYHSKVYNISTPSTYTLNSNNYNFGGWVDHLNNGTNLSLSTTSSLDLFAMYKIKNKANCITSFEKNNQRKVIKSIGTEYALHKVYESMGHVWYERSTDNGTTWTIMNNGKPLDDGLGKNPSIDFYPGYERVVIAFQNDSPNFGFAQIKVVNFIMGGKIGENYPVTSLQFGYNDVNYTPVVAHTVNENICVLYDDDNSEGLFYITGTVNYTTGVVAWGTAQQVANTTTNDQNPAISGSKESQIYHFAWQTNDTAIKYQKYYRSNGNWVLGTQSTPSTGSGYPKNYNPSITDLSGGARMCWVGEDVGGIISDANVSAIGEGENTLQKTNTTIIKSVIFKNPDYYRFWNFGSNVQAPTIAKSDDNLAYIIGWNETNTNSNKFVDNMLSSIKNFATTGNYVQVSNAPTKQEMLGLVFNTTASPYAFNKTNNIGTYYAKESNIGLSVNYGRQGLVGKDSLQFYFAIGDIIKDQQHIKFINLPEEYEVNSLEALNYSLVSEPFVINDGESFIYSVQYGMVGNQYAQLSDGKQVNFKVKLIDANTGELLRVFDNVTYSGSNLQNYNNILYQVNINEIGSKTVKMCLEVNDNLNGFYTVTDKMNDEDVLAKLNTKEVNLVENIEITSYDLFQNYPNPFNPSTTISYQVPDNCRVTLKVFDVLGKEVTTLVDEYKSKGKYDVQFNAKHLASGMYIYQIKAGDFVSSKKLMLMK